MRFRNDAQRKAVMAKLNKPTYYYGIPHTKLPKHEIDKRKLFELKRRKRCGMCGKHFTNYLSTKKFCDLCIKERHNERSKKRYNIIRMSLLKSKKCPICNKEFLGLNGKVFCSYECRYKKYREKQKQIDKLKQYTGRTEYNDLINKLATDEHFRKEYMKDI
jgi:predicted nucleic acid-binding Zn ribbon protein